MVLHKKYEVTDAERKNIMESVWGVKTPVSDKKVDEKKEQKPKESKKEDKVEEHICPLCKSKLEEAISEEDLLEHTAEMAALLEEVEEELESQEDTEEEEESDETEDVDELSDEDLIEDEDEEDEKD